MELSLSPARSLASALTFESRGRREVRDVLFGRRGLDQWSCKMTLGTILLIILILALIGAIPNWGYSSGWGYGPSGLIGTVLVVVLILVLLGKV
jgi:hypothetical protein